MTARGTRLLRISRGAAVAGAAVPLAGIRGDRAFWEAHGWVGEESAPKSD